jgi:low affinity Fe/Cu permease
MDSHAQRAVQPVCQVGCARQRAPRHVPAGPAGHRGVGGGGAVFRFSDTWQLTINTGTTIVTFLMVFVIQNTQLRDTEALHIKVDELLRAIPEAANSVIGMEDLPEEELQVALRRYDALAKKARSELRKRT